MAELTQDLSLAQARSLIDSYAFDLGRDDAEELIDYWLDAYHASWIRLATIEALYLGRYKAISIEHILSVWLRLGTPNPHFTYEFERLICRKLPKHLSDLASINSSSTNNPIASLNQTEVENEVEEIAVEPQENKLSVAVAENDTLNLEKAFGNPSHYSDSNLSLMSAIGFSYLTSSEFTEGSKMIHQFIPLPDMSSFFIKLKTFGESK
ncbi:MAG: hypothetical protein AAGF83_21925 [Cyanobacteria bacterium P01_G01_bin.67]